MAKDIGNKGEGFLSISDAPGGPEQGGAAFGIPERIETEHGQVVIQCRRGLPCRANRRKRPNARKSGGRE